MYGVDELDSVYPDKKSRGKILELYALAKLFKLGVRFPGFKLTPTLNDGIKLNSDGLKVSELLQKRYQGFSPAVTNFAVFMTFAHNRLLVDLENTDSNAIAGELANSIRSGWIRYPWVYGHDLYDRAFSFDEVREELTIEQCNDLLGVAPGVFQMAQYLVGPLGLLLSLEKRVLPPQRTLPLWHCPNPSCSGIHGGLLPQQDGEAHAASLRVNILLEDQEGVGSHWRGFFKGLVFGNVDSYYDDFCPIDLPWFLGNVFSERELKDICAKLLEQGGHLRAQFPPALNQSVFRGSNEDVVKRLSKQQTMQVVLMARDQEIVAAIDECIEKGTISIPATEIRKSPVDFQYRTWADSHFECSRLGLRIVAA
jgi:hypothetical protein